VALCPPVSAILVEVPTSAFAAEPEAACTWIHLKNRLLERKRYIIPLIKTGRKRACWFFGTDIDVVASAAAKDVVGFFARVYGDQDAVCFVVLHGVTRHSVSAVSAIWQNDPTYTKSAAIAWCGQFVYKVKFEWDAHFFLYGRLWGKRCWMTSFADASSAWSADKAFAMRST